MLQRITESNVSVFDRCIQDYQEEWAPITGEKKNQHGKYPLSSDWKPPNEGFYWVEDQEITGFCVRGLVKGPDGVYSDIVDFYVIPAFRRMGIGERMAFAIFDAYPGKWQVRQIEGADEARKFWRKIINQYTSGAFQEVEFEDLRWGPVTCQRFESRTK